MVDFTGGTWRSLIDGSEVAAIPDSDLSHYWTFAESGVEDTEDVNGDIDMAVNDGTWQSDQGIGDNYLAYESGDEPSRATSANFGTATATMMMWFRPDTTGYQVFASTNNSTQGVAFRYDLDDNREISLFLNNADGGGNLTIGGGTLFTVDVGEWAFMAGTWELATNEGILYAGKSTDDSITQVDSTTSYDDGGGDIAGADKITVGRNQDGGNEFTGAIDAPQYGIDQVLSQSDIDRFFNDSKEFYQ